jgi:hypothetical protein
MTKETLSRFAFKFNLRRYIEDLASKGQGGAVMNERNSEMFVKIKKLIDGGVNLGISIDGLTM